MQGYHIYSPGDFPGTASSFDVWPITPPAPSEPMSHKIAAAMEDVQKYTMSPSGELKQAEIQLATSVGDLRKHVVFRLIDARKGS